MFLAWYGWIYGILPLVCFYNHKHIEVPSPKLRELLGHWKAVLLNSLPNTIRWTEVSLEPGPSD